MKRYNVITQQDEPLFQNDATIVTDRVTQTATEAWKILIVDDEEDIHHLTRFVLDDYVYQGKTLKFISAYSALEAKLMCQQHEDIAIVLLDVVMENDDAGLRVVEYIRDILKNRFVRIILRTGQPGYAPEKTVILRYEINDYQNKVELTDQKLFTVITASLRSYADIMMIESYRRDLEIRVIERTSELVEKNQTLLELDREKNELLGIVAHDLKNPVAAIQSLVSLIRYHMNDNDFMEKIHRYIQMIETSTLQMSGLIKNLLDLNAIESGRMSLTIETTDICVVTQQVMNHYRERAQAKKIHLHFSATQKYEVFADRTALSQVLDNLISNAIKYSPQNTNVYVDISQEHDQIRCEVQDEGYGLTEADKQKLFGKFVRLSTRPTGNEHSTGLGLFIVKKLVEAMQGKVWCESETGKGSLFILQLPAAHYR